MATLSKAIVKARQAEQRAIRKVKEVEGKVEARVTRVLAKDGTADQIAKRLDQMALDMKKDIDRLTNKWTLQLQALKKAAAGKK